MHETKLPKYSENLSGYHANPKFRPGAFDYLMMYQESASRMPNSIESDQTVI